jgi:hypothetical protein
LRPSRLYAHVRTHDWFVVAIDFVIVVLGVYVAVWASNQQAAREREQRTGKVVAALRRDLRDFIAVDRTFEATLAPAFAAFKAARERGETPPPPVFLRIRAPTRRRRALACGCFKPRSPS